MITISAFADEIAPDLPTQMDVCETNGVQCIDVRAIDGVNVSQMTTAQAAEHRKRLGGRGFTVPCIGSPIGKITMDDDFEEHLELLKHCFETARALGTNRIRAFSFYPSAGRDITDQRQEVMERMRRMVAAAEQADCILLHENEKRIYGARPEGVKDLFATIQSASFRGIFDPANYVEEDVAPYDDGWSQGLAKLTHYLHIKDKVPGARTCVPAGQGQGQLREIFTDLKARGFSGVMALEPHMKAAGQFSGFSGPELFSQAAQGLKGLLEEVGLPYE